MAYLLAESLFAADADAPCSHAWPLVRVSLPAVAVDEVQLIAGTASPLPSPLALLIDQVVFFSVVDGAQRANGWGNPS